MRVVVGSLCTGYGGLDHAALAALGGGRVAWVADPDPHVTTLLETRLPGVPNLGDIRTVDWHTVEPVDVLTAGFPCQDISAAGRRAGIREGTRSGLFFDVIRGIKTLRPTLVVIENVAALRWRGGGLDIVLAELHHAGYDCVWTSLRASDIGAPHRRERIFASPGPDAQPLYKSGQGADKPRPLRLMTAVTTEANTDVAWGAYEPAIRRWEAILERRARLPVEPGRAGRPRLAPRFVEWLMGLDDGWVTNLELPRTAQLRILGNGFVPQQADHAITLLLRQASRPRVAPNRRTSADQSRMSRPRARLRESDDSHQAQDELDTTGRQERPSMQPSEPQAPAKASAGGWEPTQRPKEQQTLCMPSRKSIGTKIPGSLPPTVEWTAVDDEHRYHRLLVIIFGRAEATLSQVRGQQDDDERRSTPDEEHRDQDRRTQEAA